MKYFFLSLLRLPAASCLRGGLARTPQMGFNTWNSFKADINDAVLVSAAEKLVSLGLKDGAVASWVYLCQYRRGLSNKRTELGNKPEENWKQTAAGSRMGLSILPTGFMAWGWSRESIRTWGFVCDFRTPDGDCGYEL
ncbi:hypothetical protein L873DRAFT_772637 [Choiromyces venosus 120613-1]|uniref:alpha-galactosidase n=1 Tax=Choiromyces venosus 120613-1 TaxID=1336337 RepID=A0A3N4JUL7_9PEZI|nr:hypothetical protein L873DRAFT_772637 [Choiromyces venosus 120613-1]